MATQEQAGDAPEKQDAANVGQDRPEKPIPIPREKVIRRIFHEFVDVRYSTSRLVEDLNAGSLPPTGDGDGE